MLTDSIDRDDSVPLNEAEAAQIGAALGAIARRRTRRFAARPDEPQSAKSKGPLLAEAAGWINLAL